MQLAWSHAVLHVKNLTNMLDFYTRTLGFRITDRGPVGGDGSPEIVFLSNAPNEHHQIAMLQTRKEEASPGAVHHFAFRVTEFEDVTRLNEALQGLADIHCLPLSHGNTLSLYFNDPEQNGIEVFWDTPWHVPQPQGKPWDPTMDKETALNWVRENFAQVDGFEPREHYYRNRHLK